MVGRHLEGDLDLQSPSTSAVEVVAGGQLVEFAAGQASVGGDVAASLGIGSTCATPRPGPR
ncbi:MULTISPECIES: hypothetical protein [unclassified Streptomyces]|uniref:hypothetical protein n=1 Tax=unclassified Streptomyces TaxID=2593676 RepID=UPI00364D50BE